MMDNASKRVAVIPGDGVGPEVIREAIQVVDHALSGSDTRIEWTELPWGSDYYHRTGRMMPEDGLDTLSDFDAIYFGAVGDPTIPDHVTVWGLILPIRRAFDQFVNYRPIRWLEGVQPRLACKSPRDVDMLFVRENIEGEYTDLGGRDLPGYPAGSATQIAVFTEREIERVAGYAFRQARERRSYLTSITKSDDALMQSIVLWSGAPMLQHLGMKEKSEAVMLALERTHARGVATPDLGDGATTGELARSVREDLQHVLERV